MITSKLSLNGEVHRPHQICGPPTKSIYIILLKVIIKFIHNKKANSTGLIQRPTITLLTLTPRGSREATLDKKPERKQTAFEKPNKIIKIPRVLWIQ